MMKLFIEIPEEYSEAKNEFIPGRTVILTLEHSLLSISKWESRWCIPFLSSKKKTSEQSIDYVRCMTIDKCVDPRVYKYITNAQIEKVDQYVNSKMTATTIRSDKESSSRRVITSELIYCWMVEYGIPFECQKWHFSRLMTLINVCSVERNPPKKRSAKELAEYHRKVNAARRAKHNTKG